MKWIKNSKCTPWEPSSHKTLKAQDTEVFNAYTAFELTYNAYLKTPGFVEFKYRKDSKNSFIVNGEFKFAVNNKAALTDYKVSNTSDWQIYTYTFANAGIYSLSWIYTKYS